MTLESRVTLKGVLLGAALSAVWHGMAAAQQEYAGGPRPGGIDLQPAATPLQAQIIEFHSLVLVIITAITLLVLALLAWVVIRYNRRLNPKPRSFSHNSTVEVIWTIAPVLVLVLIAAYSFPLLAYQERTPKGDVFLKVIGNSWYWSYEYPDYEVSLVSNMLAEPDAKAAGKPFRLGVDEPLVVPVGSTVVFNVTSNDVIHSFGMPSFGLKEDAIPGRLNEGWFRVEREGVYYGQCYELCGINHAYMPVEIHAVSPQAFAAWITAQGGDASKFSPPRAQSAAQRLSEESRHGG
jgi:cytochrome c oxidase subunit 2